MLAATAAAKYGRLKAKLERAEKCMTGARIQEDGDKRKIVRWAARVYVELMNSVLHILNPAQSPLLDPASGLRPSRSPSLYSTTGNTMYDW